MAENLKYNLKDELLSADEQLMNSNSVIGMTMLTQFKYNNSSRSVMHTAHLKQAVNLLDPEPPHVFTNGENVVGKHSSGYKKTKNKSTVFRIIKKYEDIVDAPLVYHLFYFDEKKKKYDMFIRKESENLTERYGYRYNNEVIDSLKEGDTIKKDTVVYKSRSYDDDMNYSYGVNVPILYTLNPYTTEDACVVSDWLAERMKSIEINTVSIGVNQNDFLLDMYGKKGIYKPIPDIGEYANGELAVKRTLFTNQLLVDFKDSSLNKPTASDQSYFISGRVIDIDIYNNNPDIEETPFNSQIIKYLNSQRDFYQEILETCEEIKSSGFEYSKKINYWYKRAKEFLDPDTRWKDADSVFGNILIKVEVEEEKPLSVGQKIVGRSGNKSVISAIWPVDKMPKYKDANGNMHHIHLLYSDLGLVNRTTAFPLIEMYITCFCNQLRVQLSNIEDLNEQADLLFEFINDLNEEQAAKMRKTYDNLSRSDREKYMHDCIYGSGIYIRVHPVWETTPIFKRFLKIEEKYSWIQPYKLYINKWGRDIELLNDSYVGEMYVMKLKQTSEKGFSSRSTGSINSKGLPERSHKNKSFTELHSSTPIRFGEFETLNFAIGTMPEEVQLFHLLYRTSVKGRRDIVKQLLSPDEEFKINSSYTSRTAEIFAVLLKSLGLRLDFVDEDKTLEEYDDRCIRLYEYDGKEYLCTDYQFMLVKRRKEAEKQILKERGIVDGDEFEKLVKERILSTNYIIGPTPEEYDTTPGYKPDTVYK